MLIKSMGVALVIAGSGIWGLASARNMEKKTEQIRELRFALAFLEKEITFMHTPLSRALTKTSEFCSFPVSCFFEESADMLKKKAGITAREAWLIGIDKLKNLSQLTEKELSILSSAAQQIGMSDIDEQRKFLNLIQEELRLQEEKARQQSESGQKMRSYGGFIIGALIVLLLL